MTTKQIIEILNSYSDCIIISAEYPLIAGIIQQKQEELLKRCWQAGVDYGSNRTDKNFNDFKQQEGI